MNSLSFTRIFMNSPLVTRIQFRFIIFFRLFTLISFSFSRIHYEFTICSTNSRWLHYLSRDWHYYFAQSMRIYYLFPDFWMNSHCSAESLWIYSLFHKLIMFLLSFTRRQYEYTICYAKSLWIRYLFR